MRLMLLPILFVLLSATCKEEPSNPCENGQKAKFVDLTGLDACGLLLELENGKRLEPLNTSDFTDIEAEDQLKVWVTFTERNDMASACMAGQIIDLTCLELR